MQVLDLKVLNGPNYWSIRWQKLIVMLLDLQDLEQLPTNKIPGFHDRLAKLIPSLYQHCCSEGVEGGFFTRVKEGTWMGHVIEHIALEIQTLAGIKRGFGRTRGAGKEGVYHVVFSCDEPKEGLYAAEAALRIAEALIKGEEYDLDKDIDQIKTIWENERLGPSTASIVKEAQKRDIPFIRLDDESHVQLGYGAKQRRIQATTTDSTSVIATDLAGDKYKTKAILSKASIPVADGETIEDVSQLQQVISEIGFPVVVKPLDGNQGKGATTNINDLDSAIEAFHHAQKISKKVLVEKFIVGEDFRVLVVNDLFIAAAMRTPAKIIGDGKHTIQQLVDEVNKDKKRGNGHCNHLSTIVMDDITKGIIFGILIVPLGVVSITLVILQPVSVGYWCTLCLTSALISLIMIPFTVDEVVATIQLMIYEKKHRKRSIWTVLWFGGTMEGGEIEKKKDPKTLLEHTFKEISHDFVRRPWNLFVLMALGLWIMAAPGVLGYTGTAADNHHIMGAMVVTFAVISMSEVTRPLRFILILFGIWLIVAQWILGTDDSSAIWNGIICGILLIPLSIPKGKVEDKRGSFDKYIV